MIVIDASAMIEALVGRDADDELLEALAGDVCAPHLLDVEVLSALRGLLLGGKLDEATAEEARNNYFSLTIARYEVSPLADRVWALRHQLTSYDACYVALAEALDAPLDTCDAKLRHPGHTADVRLLPHTHGPGTRCDSSLGRVVRP
ncbi:MAG: type II toxin-antitoxin system VapC family toxin [Nocardioidaceae bacterium]